MVLVRLIFGRRAFRDKINPKNNTILLTFASLN